MKFQPRAQVEYHPQIQDLIDRQQHRQDDRQYHRDIEKHRDELLKDIQGAKEYEIMAFYCEDCKLYFEARARKQVDNWQPMAYYKTKCRCGKWCLRRITEKVWDRYWFKSLKVAKDRYSEFASILQPFETNFNLMWGKH